MNLNHLDEKMQAECHLRRDNPLVVAVSGGPDSLALLHALHTLRYHILPAHFDHMLRPSSTSEAQLLSEKMGEWGYTLLRGQGDVKQYAVSRHLSTEEAARILRYQFLFQMANEYRAVAVLTAHTADDQVETILMHILRGTGTAGLAGMPVRQVPNAWSDTIPLVRPLLEVHRAEILAYCDEQQLHPFMDETNTDLRYVRNRVRKHLIPMLENEYNPRLRQAILHLSRSMRDEMEITGHVQQQAWQNCFRRDGNDYVAFHLESLRQETPAVQRLILRKVLMLLSSDEEDVGFDVIERGVEFLKESPHGREVQLVRGLSILRVRDEVIIGSTGSTAQYPDHQSKGVAWLADYPRIEQVSVLQPGGTVRMADGWELSASEPHRCEHSLGSAVQPDHNMVCIDADRLSGPLVVRGFQAGERIQPYGMNGKSIKISDLLINEKIPRLARAGYPIIICGEQVVWVPGCRMGHAFRITAETTTCLQLRLTQPG